MLSWSKPTSGAAPIFAFMLLTPLKASIGRPVPVAGQNTWRKWQNQQLIQAKKRPFPRFFFWSRLFSQTPTHIFDRFFLHINVPEVVGFFFLDLLFDIILHFMWLWSAWAGLINYSQVDWIVWGLNGNRFIIVSRDIFRMTTGEQEKKTYLDSTQIRGRYSKTIDEQFAKDNVQWVSKFEQRWLKVLIIDDRKIQKYHTWEWRQFFTSVEMRPNESGLIVWIIVIYRDL